MDTMSAGYGAQATRVVAEKVEGVFASLERLPFLRDEDRREFRYFRRLFRSSCTLIDRRIEDGLIRPWAASAFATLNAAAAAAYPRRKPPPEEISPRRRGKRKKRLMEQGETEHPPFCVALPPGPIRVGVFIGSFDPFQMSHIQTALRFLSGNSTAADLVLVIPEGSQSSLKPGRAEYGYRFDLLRRQLEGTFVPFIQALDIGEEADTIKIVERLIALFRGRTLELTHVLGSDVLPLAVEWLPQDLDIWKPAAERYEVDLKLRMYVVSRGPSTIPLAPLAAKARKLGVEVQFDRKRVKTPSSTAVRERGIFTIIFPTEEVLEKLEVVFRYGMNRHWLMEKTEVVSDWEI